MIFDRYTLHRSGRNWADSPRFAYACQFQSDHARLAGSGERDPKRMRAQDLEQIQLEGGSRLHDGWVESQQRARRRPR